MECLFWQNLPSLNPTYILGYYSEFGVYGSRCFVFRRTDSNNRYTATGRFIYGVGVTLGYGPDSIERMVDDGRFKRLKL